MSFKSFFAAGMVSLMLSSTAFAETIVFSASADYSGPFADVMPDAMAGLKTTIDWWNREVGAGLGVDVDLRIYDMRYDAAVIARTWPSILSSDKPVIHLGFGSPDLTTLMGRLPQDKVPMLIGTAMVGLVWKPGGWHFSTRPTYSHEFAGLLSHMQEEKGGALRIAAISTQKQAGFVDQVNGVRHLAESYPDRFTFTSVQWAEAAPVSLSAQVRAALADTPDVLMVGGTTALVIASVQALEELGQRVPIISSTHNGLYEASKGIPVERLEGAYSAFSFAAPGRPNLPIRDIFDANHTEGDWGLITAQASAQAILALRVLERAVADVGADKVTGQAMYDALLGHVYTEEELLGVLPTVDYDDTAPFPVGEIASTAEVVRDGKIVGLTEGWMPVPALSQW